MECPECGAENTEGSAFCGLCSHRFAEGGAANARATVEKKPGELSCDAVESAYYKSKMRSRRRRPLWLAAGLAVMILFVSGVLALMFLHGSGKAGPEGSRTFDSRYSGLSFKYPASWEVMGKEYLKKLSKAGDVGPEEGNEIVLMKRGDVVFKHLLIVSSTQATYGNQPWSKTRDSLQAGFSDSAQTQGTSMSFLDLQLPPDAGAEGFGMMFTVEPEAKGPHQHQLEAFILKGNIAYTMVLITPLEGGGGDQAEAQQQFSDLISTVHVK